MKLSWKFFSIAYITVLLSMGLGGFILVKGTTDTLWQERIERCKSAENYAVDSFVSLSKLRLEPLQTEDTVSMERQILSVLDDCVNELEIVPLNKETSGLYSNLENFECKISYSYLSENTYVTIGCNVPIAQKNYIVKSVSDFSGVQNQSNNMWRQYRVIVLSVALISGMLLFLIALRITRPLKRLSDTAELIADGNYGLIVETKNDSSEICRLSENFNKMSLQVANSLEEIKKECEKRDTFVSNFTHEIKTPMTSIIGYSDMLSTYDLTDSEQRQAALAVRKEAKRLERLAMQLLELFITQRETPSFDILMLQDIKASVESTMKFKCEKYGCNLKIDFPNGAVYANESLVLSLLYNLVDNAVKASKKGNCVNIQAEDRGDEFKITVADTGHGIAKEHLERVTEPFYRADKARSAKKGGTGIGLALCKEICNIHNTSLEIESEQGRGTTISFYLKKGGEAI